MKVREMIELLKMQDQEAEITMLVKDEQSGYDLDMVIDDEKEPYTIGDKLYVQTRLPDEEDKEGWEE